MLLLKDGQIGTGAAADSASHGTRRRFKTEVSPVTYVYSMAAASAIEAPSTHSVYTTPVAYDAA